MKVKQKADRTMAVSTIASLLIYTFSACGGGGSSGDSVSIFVGDWISSLTLVENGCELPVDSERVDPFSVRQDGSQFFLDSADGPVLTGEMVEEQTELPAELNGADQALRFTGEPDETFTCDDGSIGTVERLVYIGLSNDNSEIGLAKSSVTLSCRLPQTSLKIPCRATYEGTIERQ